jgi:hypothetical protein
MKRVQLLLHLSSSSLLVVCAFLLLCSAGQHLKRHCFLEEWSGREHDLAIPKLRHHLTTGTLLTDIFFWDFGACDYFDTELLVSDTSLNSSDWFNNHGLGCLLVRITISRSGLMRNLTRPIVTVYQTLFVYFGKQYTISFAIPQHP